MRKIMDEKSEIIKTEIIRILNESGKIRGNELAKRVIEKVGNEKIVFRAMMPWIGKKKLVDSDKS